MSIKQGSATARWLRCQGAVEACDRILQAVKDHPGRYTGAWLYDMIFDIAEDYDAAINQMTKENR